MEQNACKVIIEFNGLPGCGKTTIAEALLKRLNAYKATVLYDIPGGIIHRLFKAFVDGSIPFILYCLLILKDFKSSTFSEKKYYLMTAYGHYQQYLHFMNYSDKRYLVVDQGLVQDIISFAFRDKLENEKYVEQLINFCLKKYNGSLLVVNCSVSVETSLQRISKRGKTDGSRLDRIYRESPEKAVETLMVQQSNFSCIRQILNAIGKDEQVFVDCNAEAEYNSGLIVEAIKTFVGKC